MKSKKPLIIIVIIMAVLVAGAAIWYAATRGNNNKSTSEGNETEQATVIEGTMFDAINQGNPLECDWKLNYDKPAVLTQGKFYTDGALGRSEAAYEYEGETRQTYAIIAEDRTYHWSSDNIADGGSIDGISDDRAEYEARKPKYDLLDTSADVDLNADYTFTCQPWTVDESLFVPPDLKYLML